MTRERLVAELTQTLSAVPGYVPDSSSHRPGARDLHGHPRTARREGARGQPRRRCSSRPLPSSAWWSRCLSGASPQGAGKPYLEFRRRIARAGPVPLDAQQVLDAVEVGIGGRSVTTTSRGGSALFRCACTLTDG